MMFFMFSALSVVNAFAWTLAIHGMFGPLGWVGGSVWLIAYCATMFCFSLGMAAKETGL